jgi:hypothetical protein
VHGRDQLRDLTVNGETILKIITDEWVARIGPGFSQSHSSVCDYRGFITSLSLLSGQ